MRVAHFIQRYPPALGGSEAYFARLSRYFAGPHNDVTVFTTNAIDLEAFWSPRGKCAPATNTDENGVHVRRYGIMRFPARRYILKALSLFPWRLGQCLTLPCNPIAPHMWRDAAKLGPFDIVHASAFPYAFPVACARRLARTWRVPFVITPFLHLGDIDDPQDRTRRSYTSPPLRWLLREADAVFAQTPHEYEAIVSLGVARERVHLQGLGVDIAECTGGDRDNARAEWGIAPEEVVIGHLANQSQEKGSIDLIKAFEILWTRGIKARLVLAGPEMPNFRKFWEAAAMRLPLEKIVRLGPLDARQKKDFFAGIDVFALPSRSDSFGLVLLEAWANGVPNVGYRAGGIVDVIRHEVDGLLARCGDVSSLADAIERLCVDANLRRELGEAGRERLPRDYDWGEKLAIVKGVYAQIC